MQENYREKEHLLSLKVMRLTKPTVKPLLNIRSEIHDLPGESFNKVMLEDISATTGAEEMACGEVLSLPQAFGSIYLGETFSCYVSILNDSNQETKDVALKTDIQTSSQRFQLTASKPKNVLVPDESQDEVLNYEVKELGTHILICAVSYTSPTNEKLYMRRFYKFQVLKPLEVKTKFYNGEHETVFLEAQVQNITTNPICMDHVTLDPSIFYNVTSLNHCSPSVVTAGATDEEIFGASYMNAMDIRQYLYKLTPKPDQLKELKAKPISTVGKLDIVWRTNFGETGRLQTSQLQRTAPTEPDVRLVLQEAPNVVGLEKQFTLKCRLENGGTNKMEVKLFLTNPTSNTLLWCGVSGKVLGPLPPNSHLDLELYAIIIKPGLHTVGGVKILDMNSTRVHDFNNVCKILAYADDESPFR